MGDIFGGSIQDKNGWKYFVFRAADGDGKAVQRWVPLKTRDEAVAVERVRDRFAPGTGGSDEKWLRHLVKLGTEAEELLRERADAAGCAFGWDVLWCRWLGCADRLTDNVRTLGTYEGQVRRLAEWAVPAGFGCPAELDAAGAQRWIEGRPADAQKRDKMLFMRMWRELGLRAVWDGVRRVRAAGGRFRRLEVCEVRNVVRALRGGSVDGFKVRGGFKAQPALADMVVLGFFTGLRRNVVASLVRGCVDGNFLVVEDAKNKWRGGDVGLVVPLVHEARDVVRRRLEGGDDRLFPELQGAVMSKMLRLGFVRAGVLEGAAGAVGFRSLRATFISLMDEAGVNPYITDAITGHRGGSTHKRYTQPARGALLDAVSGALPGLDV